MLLQADPSESMKSWILHVMQCKGLLLLACCRLHTGSSQVPEALRSAAADARDKECLLPGILA